MARNLAKRGRGNIAKHEGIRHSMKGKERDKTQNQKDILAPKPKRRKGTENNDAYDKRN